MGIGKGWDRAAHDEWQAGRANEAIVLLLKQLNQPDAVTAELALQASYYLFLGGDLVHARHVLETAARQFPDHLPLCLNLAVLQNRTGDPVAARATLEAYLAKGGDDVTAYDGLCASCHRAGDDEAARRYGCIAIERKTSAAIGADALSLGEPREGRSIISFSLWGDQPRYLRGALQNAIRAQLVYPGFTCRFYVDDSVPADLLAALERQGAELVRETGLPSTRHRLTRRFLVADDPEVGRYLVRDCDSLVNAREAAAVADWIASGLQFHVMRDWWTHTDPMLAGMWGGRGGVLPPMAPLIASYQSGAMETPNWDQWFLRDRIWPSIHSMTLVHDRLFDSPGARPFPSPMPSGNLHVGQNEFVARKAGQARELAAFASRVPSLKL